MVSWNPPLAVFVYITEINLSAETPQGINLPPWIWHWASVGISTDHPAWEQRDFTEDCLSQVQQTSKTTSHKQPTGLHRLRRLLFSRIWLGFAIVLGCKNKHMSINRLQLIRKNIVLQLCQWDLMPRTRLPVAAIILCKYRVWQKQLTAYSVGGIWLTAQKTDLAPIATYIMVVKSQPCSYSCMFR